ncbi:succinate dehydrogenase, hydrophobic membrane anchor protein [Agrobacterium vitis]|uniref:succinate dehydrogenase, hydrophobic membrane anchor protein n=1 Tax=Agrobacterium vitis TaxID=373 RepID=UPI0018D20CEC|nr:succinate dehydrogenase, hydrophobic membrane anchor protein [Agrobacterium vitis]
MRTALGRVLGLGSARSGTDDFVKDRLRSFFLLLLTPYIVGIGIWLYGRPYNEVRDNLSSPLVLLPLALFVVLGILHMRIGMQTIIEDYIHRSGWKLVLTLINMAFCLVLATVCLFAVLQLSVSR